MAKLGLVLLLLFSSIAALSQPWIGALCYYVFSILAPQYIWHWAFDGIPAFTIIAGFTIVGMILGVASKKIDLGVHKNRQSLMLFLIFIFMNLSDIFSPFPHFTSFTASNLVKDTYNTIFIMYMVCLPVLTKEEHVKKVTYAFLAVIIYYVYWSNDAYFNFQPHLFGRNGRLSGPFGSPYRDENVFSTIFLVGMPFILFGIFYFETKVKRAVLFLVLLMLWHSIILTGSRGALLALATSTLFSYFLVKSRLFGIVILAGLFAAIIYQGGQMLSRTTETIETAKEEPDQPLNPRLQSWQTGIELIQKHPLLGVGVQRFQEATRHYFPDRLPYVAHNTFLNFAANMGLTTGLIYLYMYLYHFKNYRYAARSAAVKNNRFLDYLNKSTITALTAFYVNSMFLDLIIFEAFYFMLMLATVKHFLIKNYNSQSSDSTLSEMK